MPWERDPGSEARFSAFVDEATMKEPELQYYGAWRIMPSEDRMRLWKMFTNGHGKDMMEGKVSSVQLQLKNATHSFDSFLLQEYDKCFWGGPLGLGSGLYFRVFECDDAPGGDSNYEEHWLWLEANGTTIMRRTLEKHLVCVVM